MYERYQKGIRVIKSEGVLQGIGYVGGYLTTIGSLQVVR